MFSQIVVQVTAAEVPCFVAVQEGTALRIVVDDVTGQQLREAINNPVVLPLNTERD